MTCRICFPDGYARQACDGGATEGGRTVRNGVANFQNRRVEQRKEKRGREGGRDAHGSWGNQEILVAISVGPRVLAHLSHAPTQLVTILFFGRRPGLLEQFVAAVETEN
eukprot:9494902-Pyramimonas_sp.AAC.2